MEEIKVDNLVVEKYEACNGSQHPPLLLIHGAYSGSWSLQTYAKFFASSGRDVYSLNLKGHHKSDPEENLGDVSFFEYVADVKKIVEHLQLKDPVILGHSMGGLIAQKLAEDVTASALILIATAPPKGLEKYLPTPGERPEINPLPPSVPNYKLCRQYIFNNMDEEQAKKVFDLMGQESTLVKFEVAAGIKTKIKRNIPKLVIGFKQDTLTHIDMQKDVAKLYDADFKIYDKLAHFGVMEKGWQLPATDIRAWLSQKVG